MLRMKIVVAGNSAVGKTALVQAFHGDATLFAKNYNMTVGVDLVVKSVNIPDSGAVVEMYLCDCSGKEIFQRSLETHWHHAAGVCLVFDLTDEGSLVSCSSWMQCLGSFHVAGVLVGTKADLTARRVVSAERAQSVAASLGLNYFETSAVRLGGNV
uniref:intraflagellar transport protein 27 homolog isoform X2 n=1 Tax=Myxine glutinosa TaxID=7769 RepID=UPI00358FDD50